MPHPRWRRIVDWTVLDRTVLDWAVLALVSILVPGATASAQPAGSSFSAWVGNLTQQWQTQIDRWRLAGDICFWLTVTVGVLGIVIGALQPLKRRWVKSAVVVLGVLISSLTLVKTARYESDHHSYYRAADAAELRVRRIQRWARPVADPEEEREAIAQVRALLDELEQIAARFDATPAAPVHAARDGWLGGVAFAQSLPAADKPDWLTGRAPEGDRVFFVGVAIDAALAAARRASFDNAIAAARGDLAARLGQARGYDTTALAEYLAEGASVADRYFDREPQGGYRYYTLVAMSRSRMEVDARLFGFRDKVQVPEQAVQAVQSVRPSSIAYQVRREETYATLGRDARQRVGTESYRAYETGRAARLKGDARSAVEALQAAVRASPEFFLAWYNLGLAQEAAGDRRAAEEAYRKALALEPGQPARDPSIYNTCGWLLYREGRYADALPLFEQALALEPSHATARRNLEATREKLGTR